MFARFLSRGQFPIGLELGDRHVRMLQLAAGPEGLRVQAAAARALPDHAHPDSPDYHRAVGDAVGAMLAEGAFQHCRVVSCLPSTAMHGKSLRLPRMPEAELASAIRWEARERMPDLQDPFDLQYLHAGEVRQGEDTRLELIVLAVPTDFVEAHVAALTERGLRPQAVDIAPAALVRAHHRLAGAETGVRVLVDVGEDVSDVVIHRDGRLMFYKRIEVGTRRLDQAIAEQLDTSLDEAASIRRRIDAPDTPQSAGGGEPAAPDPSASAAARPVLAELAQEVQLCLRYYSVTFRGARPESVAIVGQEAARPWLVSTLADEAGVRVQPLDPLAEVDTATAALGPDDARPAWAVAAGLTLRTGERGRERRAA